MLRDVRGGRPRGKKKRGANIPSYPITGDNGDLDRRRMVVFGPGGDACGSNITFHSGSLRDENMKEQRREKRKLRETETQVEEKGRWSACSESNKRRRPS